MACRHHGFQRIQKNFSRSLKTFISGPDIFQHAQVRFSRHPRVSKQKPTKTVNQKPLKRMVNTNMKNTTYIMKKANILALALRPAARATKSHLGAAILVMVLVVELAASATAEKAHYLYIWAGDQARIAPDFVTVVDFDEDSTTYGTILKTVPVPTAGNEAHHMQPVGGWHHPGRRRPPEPAQGPGRYLLLRCLHPR